MVRTAPTSSGLGMDSQAVRAAMVRKLQAQGVVHPRLDPVRQISLGRWTVRLTRHPESMQLAPEKILHRGAL